VDRKRAALIFAAAWISAALLSWFLYRRTRDPQSEQLAVVVAARRDLIAGTLLKDSDLAKVTLRKREAPKGHITRPQDAVNRAVLVDVAANEPLLDQKLARRSGTEGIAATIEEGKRAVAVKVEPNTGLLELLEPNSRVDVIYTRPGRMAEAITTTVLQNVKVLSVGRRVRPGEKVDTKATRLPVVTLVVTPEEAQKLELAKSQGKISLVMRNAADPSRLANTQPVTTEALDPLALVRGGARRPPTRAAPRVEPEPPAGNGEAGNSPDLKKKKKAEPPPRAVVDVFRGAKHTQEVFR